MLKKLHSAHIEYPEPLAGCPVTLNPCTQGRIVVSFSFRREQDAAARRWPLLSTSTSHLRRMPAPSPARESFRAPGGREGAAAEDGVAQAVVEGADPRAAQVQLARVAAPLVARHLSGRTAFTIVSPAAVAQAYQERASTNCKRCTSSSMNFIWQCVKSFAPLPCKARGKLAKACDGSVHAWACSTGARRPAALNLRWSRHCAMPCARPCLQGRSERGHGPVR